MTPKYALDVVHRYIVMAVITTTLRHIPFGDSYSLVKADRPRFRCSSQGCEYSEIGSIPFKAQGHLITEPLKLYTEALLAYGMTLKEFSHIKGLQVRCKGYR